MSPDLPSDAVMLCLDYSPTRAVHPGDLVGEGAQKHRLIRRMTLDDGLIDDYGQHVRNQLGTKWWAVKLAASPLWPS